MRVNYHDYHLSDRFRDENQKPIKNMSFANVVESDDASDDYADYAEDYESVDDDHEDEANAASDEGGSQEGDVFDVYVAYHKAWKNLRETRRREVSSRPRGRSPGRSANARTRCTTAAAWNRHWAETTLAHHPESKQRGASRKRLQGRRRHPLRLGRLGSPSFTWGASCDYFGGLLEKHDSTASSPGSNCKEARRSCHGAAIGTGDEKGLESGSARANDVGLPRGPAAWLIRGERRRALPERNSQSQRRVPRAAFFEVIRPANSEVYRRIVDIFSALEHNDSGTGTTSPGRPLG